MRKFIILCTLTATLLLPVPSQAQWGRQSDDGPWSLHSKHNDFGSPFDGFDDPGSRSNPWVLEGPGLNNRYEIHPQMRDMGSPYDGLYFPGSRSNPWVIERK